MKLAIQFVVWLTTAVALAQSTDTMLVRKREAVSKIVIESLVSRGLGPEELPRSLDLSALPAAAASELRVQNVSWDRVRRVIQIRLQCEAENRRMAFLVQGRVPQDAEASVREKLADNRQALMKTEAGKLRVARTGRTPILVQAGKPATLLWQKEAMRLSTPVVCLRSGRYGDQIPVRTREGKHIMRARVVGVGTVAVL